VTIDFHGAIAGAEFQGSSGSGQQTVLGAGRLLPDFEANVIGVAAGESKTFDVRFPDDYHGREVAGKTARFEVTVREVAGPVLPAVDADFAKSLGVADGDMAKMRAEIRANVEREVKAKLKARLREQVMQALLDATKMETPKGLLQMEVQRMREGMRRS